MKGKQGSVPQAVLEIAPGVAIVGAEAGEIDVGQEEDVARHAQGAAPKAETSCLICLVNNIMCSLLCFVK